MIFTLGGRWLDHYLAGIALVRSLSGQTNVQAAPKSDPTPESLVRVLQGVAMGDLNTSHYTQACSSPTTVLVGVPPPLSPETDYLLIGLNAETARSRCASLTTGGVIFADPIWALLAAHAVSVKDRPWRAVPRARDANDLWKRVLVVAGAIEEECYNPAGFLRPTERWVPPSETPRFELLTVSAEQITALRARGVQALGILRPPKLFELYQSLATP